MSNPYGPNQQPVNGDNNGQHSAEQQPTEQLPAVNYSQQTTQQMPAAGGYGQAQPGYAQQQGYTVKE